MINKVSVLAFVVILMLSGGYGAMAQDVCVTDYMANLASPTTVSELRQYIDDLREVLSECDPVAENVKEVEPKGNPKADDLGEDDNGCLYGIVIVSRKSSPEIFGMAQGERGRAVFFEMKKPGQSKFEEARYDKHMSDQMGDDIYTYLWVWDGPFRKGRYEVRYEAFVGAEPVTLAFDVEYNAEYFVLVSCRL